MYNVIINKIKNPIILILIIATTLTSCAEVNNIDQCLPIEKHSYNFWAGIWHGLITPISFIGSLIWEDIAVYAVNNNGSWYDFGFLLGLSSLSFSIKFEI